MRVTLSTQAVRLAPGEAEDRGSMAKQLTAEHKEALEAGRVAGRAIKAYLKLIEAGPAKQPRPSRTVKADLAKIEADLAGATSLQRLSLIQQRIDLREELAEATSGGPTREAIEAEFVEHVARYSASKGFTYAAWREFGVPAEVLRRAGLSGR